MSLHCVPNVSQPAKVADGTSQHPVFPADPSSSFEAILSSKNVVQQLDVSVHEHSDKSADEV